MLLFAVEIVAPCAWLGVGSEYNSEAEIIDKIDTHTGRYSEIEKVFCLVFKIIITKISNVVTHSRNKVAQ